MSLVKKRYLRECRNLDARNCVHNIFHDEKLLQKFSKMRDSEKVLYQIRIALKHELASNGVNDKNMSIVKKAMHVLSGEYRNIENAKNAFVQFQSYI